MAQGSTLPPPSCALPRPSVPAASGDPLLRFERATIAEAAPVTAQIIQDISDEIATLARAESRQAEAAETLTVDCAGLLVHSADTTKIFSLFVKLSQELVRVCQKAPGRDAALGNQLVNVAAYLISQQYVDELPQKGRIFEDCQAFLSAYENSHKLEEGIQYQLPKWFIVAATVFKMRVLATGLPCPIVYARNSSAMCGDQTLRRLIDEYGTIEELDLKNAGNAAYAQQSRANEERKAQIAHDLAAQLGGFSDIFPETIEACQQEISLNPKADETFLCKFQEFHYALSALILTSLDSSSERARAVPCVEVVKEGETSGLSLSAYNVCLKDRMEDRQLAALIRIFTDLSAALAGFGEYLVSKEGDQRAQMHISESLAAILPSSTGEDKSSEVSDLIFALHERQDPDLSSAVFDLCAAKLKRDVKRLPPNAAEYPIEKGANAATFAALVRYYLFTPGVEVGQIKQTLQGNHFVQTKDMLLQIRAAFEAKNWPALRDVLESSIDLAKSQSGKTTFCYSLLESLYAIATNNEICPFIRNQLKNFKAINGIASDLLSGVAKSSPVLSRRLEYLRSEIQFRLDCTLDDYFGRRDIIHPLQEGLAEHQLWLNNRWAWQDIPAHLLFPNGYLLFGGPGEGKTFLPRCLANSARLPFCQISVAEMRSNMADAAGAFNKDVFTNYMISQIKMAQAARQVSGVPAAILFLDEIESLFPNRENMQVGSAEHTAVNDMLELIENLMKQHPDVIFIGATNYIHKMDLAARRIGRFGLLIELAATTEDDVAEIIKGTFSKTGLPVPNELTERPASKQAEFEEEEVDFNQLAKEATGTIALTLQLAIHQAIVSERIKAGKGNTAMSPSAASISMRVRRLRALNKQPLAA